ncbi:MAG: bifunctional phosphopantothenoylcysteine decarboxylase/phosphopantothenate--cysteine ligase CoaBC, partial [Pseudomonadota bacterium]|nr:bifunctional phosphopantothenoylcysteine decarboxylase/phosphopantothenate--cysteine ligase CoaBC [Pseudomonadota bacterium]
MTLKNKKILIIIGGGIAAYKSLDLIRLFKKNGNEVKTILTKSGKEFVTPLSVSTLTKNKTFENIFDKDSEVEIDHISLSRWADLIIVLPTTANFMTKLSLGKAEDLATTVILASNKDILLVPAMNVRMWIHKATQQNVKILKDYGYLFIGPEKGEMACGEYGEGKMSSPRQIYSFIEKYFNKKNIVKSKNLKALVTAGPTREYLDPVRYISNESSGKQGFEIAEALSRLGIKTTLITGPSNLSSAKDIKTKKIITANEMYEAVKKCLPVDIAVCAAAVADFKPIKKSKIKIKKDNINSKSIGLERNKDIVEF